MENETTTKTSSVAAKPATPITNDQFKMPTWALLVGLVVALVVLKSFIYIKDSKRHGK